MKTTYTFLVTLLCLLLGACAVQAQTFTPVDINPGVDSSYPTNFASLNDKVFFQADDGIHGAEVWVSDGTPGGTSMLLDIWPGAHGSGPEYFTPWNNRMYFSADDSVHGFSVWSTDGTPGGTSALINIPPGYHVDGPYYFTPFNNKLYFGAQDGAHGNELWVTDGTTAGTSLLADIWPGTGSSDPAVFGGFVVSGGKLFFDANDSVHGRELWVSDGTTAGTHMLADIAPGTASSFPGAYGCFFEYNNKIYFSANDTVHGFELWVTDGTPSGTNLLKDIYPGAGNSFAGYGSYNVANHYQYTIGGFYLYNNKFYFGAIDSLHGLEMWKSDGTTLGTTMVKDIYPGPGHSYASYEKPQVYNNLLYFTATDTGADFHLWATDGTPGGTHVVSDSLPLGNANPVSLTAAGNLLYFIAHDSIVGNQLFSTNGTDTGTHMLSPAVAPNIDPLGHSPKYLYPFNNSLVFAASYTSIGLEPWFYTLPYTAVGSISNLPSLRVYPNPFTGHVMVDGLLDRSTYNFTFSDMNGRIIESSRITGTGGEQQMDIPSVSPGIYLLHLTNGENATTLKLVKE